MIFLDSGNIDDVLKYMDIGIIRGVTSNPTILKRDGVSSSKIKDRMISIADLIAPYPLSVEVTSNEESVMLAQARDIASWANNINIKIPIHGPNGESNLGVVKQLSSEGIDINVTAMMNAQQCLLAAMAGAKYVSLFGGRVNDMGYNCIKEVRKIRCLIDKFNLESKIIMGSVREPLNVVEWLASGADIVTVPPNILGKMIVHPYTASTVKQFLTDSGER